MNKEVEYWKWKNTIIDFNSISNEKDEYGGYLTKKDIVFNYLGTPDDDIHEWYNGGFSSEYNTALRYAKQLGLVENYIDYDEKLYTLKSRIDKAIEYINKYAWQEDIIGGIYTTDGKPAVDRYMRLEWDNCNELLEILKGDNNE